MEAPAVAAQAPLASATSPVLPGVRHFDSPFADPLEPRASIGLIATDLLAARGGERPPFELSGGPAVRDDARMDWQAVAALGVTVPLLRLAEWSGGGVVVSGQAGVFGRFRLESPSRDDLGQDWVAALPVEVAHGDVSARLRLSHRSSHLGDEFVDETEARRLEFGGEAIDGLVGYGLGSARVYGGGAWIFHSTTDDEPALRMAGRRDRFLVQLGADADWPVSAKGDGRLRAGIDWQAAERTNWRGGVTAAAGLTYRVGARSAGLVLRYYDGLSALGQFLWTPERYWGMELNIVF